MSEQVTGAELLIDALKKNDLKNVYGVVGIPVTDLARMMQRSGMRYFGFRREDSAVNAAAASGFLTGKPGLALTVSAPGFLNGLVALGEATKNCFPVIMISGSSERHIIDLNRGDYEGLDQYNIAKPFCKAAYRVDRPEDMGWQLPGQSGQRFQAVRVGFTLICQLIRSGLCWMKTLILKAR